MMWPTIEFGAKIGVSHVWVVISAVPLGISSIREGCCASYLPVELPDQDQQDPAG
jgi:hypothetical protein